MENYKKNIVELASNLAFEYSPFPSPISPYPKKTEICKKHPPIMHRTSAEGVGVSSRWVKKLFEALENEPEANVHSIVIARFGKIIAEASAPGYDARVPHLSHSMSKSIIGILIMMLSFEGKLDTGAYITDFFRDIPISDKRIEKATVDNLLTMTSGVGFGEAGVVSEERWTEAYFLSEMGFSPGERFAYNSMNSYILARIADKICQKEYGIDGEEYIYRRLFLPIGIPKPLWEKSAEGTVKGGFGMYMSAEAWAAVGTELLYSAIGKSNSLIPTSKVIEGIERRVKTSDAIGDFDYGYHFWVRKDGGSILFNGMFGQNVLIDLNSGFVIAVTAGNNELFSKSPTLEAITSHVRENSTRGSIFRSKRELSRASKHFFENRRWINTPRSTLPFFFSDASGRRADFLPVLGSYTFAKNNQSILPAFVRTMQNNFTGGIKSFEIFIRHGMVHLTSNEGACTISLKFGLFSHVRNEIDVLGEKYAVMALAGVEHSDGEEAVYKFELIFPELPNSRRITLSKTPLGRLKVKMHEMPDEKITDSFVDAIPTLSGRIGVFYKLLEQKLGKRFVEEKLKELFSPEFTAFSTDMPDYEAALNEENKKIDEIVASSKLVRSLIFNFLGNKEKTKEDGGGALGKIAGMLGKIF